MTRAAVAAVFLLSGSDPVRLPVLVTVPFVILVVVICFLDSHRHREGALLGNLGVGPALLAVMFMTPAILGELALRLATAALT